MAEFRTLRAGVFLPPFHPNDEDPLLCMERDFELMQWLDALDYAEAWIGEHHSGGYEIYGQPELFIATAAERTRYIRLGTGVISLPYHHPFMVADRIVQLDYQTRGRAMFGFGPGLLPSDAMMLGIDPETQRDRMADAIDVITRLLAGEVIFAALHGNMDLSRHGFPAHGDLDWYQPATGWIVISLTQWAFGTNPPPFDGYAWLKPFEPVATIGKTVRLYYVDPS